MRRNRLTSVFAPGKPPSIPQLNTALLTLYRRLLPASNYTWPTRDDVMYEELLHEFGHHVTLNITEWRTPRTTNLGTDLYYLSPGAGEGNECDALAFSILVSELLGHAIGLEYVDMAVRMRNLKILSKTQARHVIRSLLESERLEMLSSGFVEEVYSIFYVTKDRF